MASCILYTTNSEGAAMHTCNVTQHSNFNGDTFFNERDSTNEKKNLPLYRLMTDFMLERKRYWDELEYEKLIFLNDYFAKQDLRLKELAAYLFNSKQFEYMKKWAGGNYKENPDIKDLDILPSCVFELKEIVKNNSKVLSDIKILKKLLKEKIFFNKNFYEENYALFYRKNKIGELWKKKCELLIDECQAWDFGNISLARSYIQKLSIYLHSNTGVHASVLNEVYTKGKCLFFVNFDWSIQAKGNYINEGFIFNGHANEFSFYISEKRACFIPDFIRRFKNAYITNSFYVEAECILGLERITLNHKKIDNFSWQKDFINYCKYAEGLE